MSITRSYNRRTNTWYAYETNYVWDESRQKKVQKRKCIGKFDSNNKIIKNGSRGRPRLTPESLSDNTETSCPCNSNNYELKGILERFSKIEKLANTLSTEIISIKNELYKFVESSSLQN